MTLSNRLLLLLSCGTSTIFALIQSSSTQKTTSFRLFKMVTTRRATSLLLAKNTKTENDPLLLTSTTAPPLDTPKKRKSTSTTKKVMTTKKQSNMSTPPTTSTPPLVKPKRTKSIVSPSKKSLLDNSIKEDVLRMINGRRVLFSLNSTSTGVDDVADNSDNDNSHDNNDLVSATILSRPSKRNRSPYVADVWLVDEQREAIAHVPNLDMGGKCIPGSMVLLKASRDKKSGTKVGPDAVSSKYGTPKCEFITQLLYVDDGSRVMATPPSVTTNEAATETTTTIAEYQPNVNEIYPPVWIGAHPSLGERIAETWLKHNLLYPVMPKIIHVQNQVTNPCGADNIRSDFCVTHEDGTKRIIEVKTVVDTDYSAAAIPQLDILENGTTEVLPTTTITTSSPITASSSPRKTTTKKKKAQCVFTSDKVPYTRTAIFPWGNSNQKGPNGEAVVSARAIHHVRELTRIASGELTDGPVRYKSTILFVVIRDDAEQFRPNHEACPSFCHYLQEADQAGVQIVAKRVSWGKKSTTTTNTNANNEVGLCFDDKIIPVEWPTVHMTN